jgi:hypothetical protein
MGTNPEQAANPERNALEGKAQGSQRRGETSFRLSLCILNPSLTQENSPPRKTWHDSLQYGYISNLPVIITRKLHRWRRSDSVYILDQRGNRLRILEFISSNISLTNVLG